MKRGQWQNLTAHHILNILTTKMETYNTTDRFLDCLEEIVTKGLSQDDLHQAKRCFLDYLGATLAGAKMLGNRGLSLVGMMEASKGQGCSSVIGFHTMASLHTASFVNGLSAHTAELDDGVISGIIHPGAPVFSGLLPVMERYNVDSYLFYLGAVVGYEVSVRLANAIQPSHKVLGYHASATCGMIGTAMGIAVMLGYNRQELKDTFACALASAHGTLKVLQDDSELKPFNIATASSDGLVAALMGKAGFKGADDPLEGYSGFFAQFSKTVDKQRLWKNENGKLAIYDVYVKPYAACRYCHPSIENALIIRGEKGFSVEDIEHIYIETYSLAVNKHDHTTVNNVSSAKMSIPFATAVSLCLGSASVDAYCEESIHDQAISDLMKKISVAPNDDFSSKFPQLSIATMVVKCADGRTFESRTEQPKGEAAFPLSDKELMEKFVSLAIFYGMNEERARQLSNSILYDSSNAVTDFVKLL